MSDSYTAAIAARSDARKLRGLVPDDSDAAYRVAFDVRAEMQKRGEIAGGAAFEAAFKAAFNGDDVGDVKRAAWEAAQRYNGEK